MRIIKNEKACLHKFTAWSSMDADRIIWFTICKICKKVKLSGDIEKYNTAFKKNGKRREDFK